MTHCPPAKFNLYFYLFCSKQIYIRFMSILLFVFKQLVSFLGWHSLFLLYTILCVYFHIEFVSVDLAIKNFVSSVSSFLQLSLVRYDIYSVCHIWVSVWGDLDWKIRTVMENSPAYISTFVLFCLCYFFPLLKTAETNHLLCFFLVFSRILCAFECRPSGRLQHTICRFLPSSTGIIWMSFLSSNEWCVLSETVYLEAMFHMSFGEKTCELCT